MWPILSDSLPFSTFRKCYILFYLYYSQFCKFLDKFLENFLNFLIHQLTNTTIFQFINITIDQFTYYLIYQFKRLLRDFATRSDRKYFTFTLSSPFEGKDDKNGFPFFTGMTYIMVLLGLLRDFVYRNDLYVISIDI